MKHKKLHELHQDLFDRAVEAEIEAAKAMRIFLDAKNELHKKSDVARTEYEISVGKMDDIAKGYFERITQYSRHERTNIDKE